MGRRSRRGHRLVMVRLVLCALFAATAALLLLLPPPGPQAGAYVTLPVDHLTGVDRYGALIAQGRTATAYRASLEDRRVDIGGYRLHLRCAGHGSPTVMFE